MTSLKKPVRRVTLDALPAHAGADRDRRIVVTLVPGNGNDVPDLLELRPERTRRPRRAALVDIWNYLVRCDANVKRLEKTRIAKARKDAQRKERAWRRELRQSL